MKNDSSLFEISYPHVSEVLLVLVQIMSAPIRSGADNASADRGRTEKSCTFLTAYFTIHVS